MYANNPLSQLFSLAPGLCSRVGRPTQGGEHGRRLETLLHVQILHRLPEDHLALQVSWHAERIPDLWHPCAAAAKEEVVQTNIVHGGRK